MESLILNNLYNEYDIANLPFGRLQDKLGDVYEKFVINVLENTIFLNNYKGSKTCND